MKTNNSYVSLLLSTLGTTRASYNENFRIPNLSEDEMKSCFRLVLDTWDNTSCSGNHAQMEELFEGGMVTATGFSESLGSMKY